MAIPLAPAAAGADRTECDSSAQPEGAAAGIKEAASAEGGRRPQKNGGDPRPGASLGTRRGAMGRREPTTVAGETVARERPVPSHTNARGGRQRRARRLLRRGLPLPRTRAPTTPVARSPPALGFELPGREAALPLRARTPGSSWPFSGTRNEAALPGREGRAGLSWSGSRRTFAAPSLSEPQEG
jgi:hypothetical protein